jgi:MFS family permease
LIKDEPTFKEINMRTKNRYPWLVVLIFFSFILLHQSDKLLISPLTTPIMETFNIDEAQMGAVFTGALLVGALMYPLWGYLYDKYARSKLLALASFIWGSTTWLSAIAPTYKTFLATRASTGIDDSSYPGLFSLMSDYFGPEIRGRVYGLLQLAQPLGYLVGMVAATFLGGALGWRSVFYITGSLGLLLAIIIFFGIRDVPRGSSEPEFADLAQIGVYHFDLKIALKLFKKKSLLFLFAQGFVGVFPWQVITYWFFRYLETERGYDENTTLITMASAVIILSLGYFMGGAVGDFMFKRTPRGRMLTSAVGVLLGAIFLIFAINVPDENQTLFLILLWCTALFMPVASANVIATVYDITLPEVRSTALSVQYFIENGGAALAPWLAGLIAVGSSLETAILTICVSAWILGFVILLFTAYFVPTDIQILRDQLSERAAFEREQQSVS